jgi:Xaa-Pro aminopeptidase
METEKMKLNKAMMLEFPLEEYRARLEKLAAGMARHGMDAVLLSSKENTRYFSGLQSIVWDSKVAVPGLLIVTAEGDLTIVSSAGNQPNVTVTSCVPEEALVAYRRSPGEDGLDSFPKAVAYALEKFGVLGGRIGMELGYGFRLHITHADREAILARLKGGPIRDCGPLLWELRSVKSPAEVERLAKVCEINVSAYKKGFDDIVCGQTTEDELYRAMAAESFRLGAEGMLQLGIRCGHERYPQGNSPPSNRVIGLKEGEILLVDGGPCYKGYYSDIIRQAVSGEPSSRQQYMYDIAVEGIHLGLSKIKAGVRACDVCRYVDDFFIGRGMGEYDRYMGGVGHGLGLDVHEMPMLAVDCETVLQPGMVMAIEPELFDGEIGVFGIENNFVVTQTGYELLSPAPEELRRLPMGV